MTRAGRTEQTGNRTAAVRGASPCISVVMPVRNAVDTIEQAVTSIRRQTDADWELIVVDDASTDATPALLADCCRRDGRIRIARQDTHLGIAAALNLGLGAARGNYIARMDADDISRPQRLRRQRQFLETHPEIGLVACRVEFGGDRQRQAGYAAYVDWTNSLLTPEAIARNRFVESPLAHPSVMFRRALAVAHGGYRQGAFPEDYELWLRWLEAGVRMAKLADELLVWQDPPQRLSRRDSRYSRMSFYQCKAEYLARWLALHNPSHPEVIVWGAGRETRRRAELLVEHGVEISDYVDIDPNRIGQRIHGRMVLHERQLATPGNVFVVSYVGSRGARNDIRARLCALGYRELVDFVIAA